MVPNICFIILDAARPDHFSGYSHDRVTTPNIDAIMDESVVFTRPCAPTGVTIDSVASLLSGRYPMEHKSGRAGRLNIDSPLLPELLQGAGYRTAAVTCNPFLSPAFGFDIGFDEMNPVTQFSSTGMNMRQFYSETNHLPAWKRYLIFIKRAADRNLISHLQNALQFRFDLFEDDGASKATDWATDFVAEAENPWFLYAHYTETHMNSGGDLPYSVPDEYLFKFLDDDEDLSGLQTRTQAVEYSAKQRDLHGRLYDGALRYLDEKVGELIEILKRTNRWDETIFIVTADHGELLGEHGLLGHGYLHEPVIHVPLVIKLPASDDRRGCTIDSRFNTLSLVRTLAEYVDCSVPDQASGVNIFTESPEYVMVQDYSQTWEWSRYGGERDGRHAIYHDEQKLIVQGDNMELYDLTDDPDEEQDIADQFPDRVVSLREELDAMLDAKEMTADPGNTELDVDDAARDRLADLGYL